MSQKTWYERFGMAVAVGILAAATILASNWLFGGKAHLTRLEPDDFALTLAIGLILGPIAFGPRHLIRVLNALFVANFVYLLLVIGVALCFFHYWGGPSFAVDISERVAVHATMISIGVWVSSFFRHQSVA